MHGGLEAFEETRAQQAEKNLSTRSEGPKPDGQTSIHLCLQHLFPESDIIAIVRDFQNKTVLLRQCKEIGKRFQCFQKLTYVGTKRSLRNREKKKNRETTSQRRVFPQLFRLLTNFHECYVTITLWKLRSFLFLLENKR